MKNRKPFLFTTIVQFSLLLTVLFFSCTLPSSDPGTEDDGPTTADEILANLNVNTDNLADQVLTNTQGEEVVISPEWHPLGKPYSTFSPKAEVMQFGIPVDGTYNTLYEDTDASYSRSTGISGDQGWQQNNLKRSVAADIDGDGIDEFIVFYKTDGLNMVICDNGVFGSPTTVPAITPHTNWGMKTSRPVGIYAGGLPFPYLTKYYDPFQITAADIDGDGTQELLIANGESAYIASVSVSGNSLSVDETKSFAGRYIGDIDAGDIDGDGADEFVIGFMGTSGFSASPGYGIFDSSFSSSMTSSEFMNTGYSNIVASEVVLGDFDGDRVDEIIFIETYSTDAFTADAFWATIYQYDNNQFIKHNNTMTIAAITVRSLFHSFGDIGAAADVDGDGQDEFMFAYQLVDKVMTAPTLIDPGINAHGINRVWEYKVGDIDGNGKEEILYLGSFQEQYDYSIHAMGVDSSGTTSTFTTMQDYSPVDSPDQDSNGAHRVTFAVGNIDNDTPRVKYVDHKLEFTNPIILAALASPPYYSEVAAADANYGYTDWATYYGESSGTTTGDTTSIGASIGTTVEVEQGVSVFGIQIAQFKASASFKAENSNSWTTEHSIEKSVKYSCTGGEDRIIFTSVPMDVYSYEIVDSSIAGEEGKILSIEIPRDFDYYSVTREFYNSHNDILADVDDSDVFAHTLGMAKTYPDLVTKNRLMVDYPGGYSSDSAQSVVQANTAYTSGGIIELAIDVEESNIKETSFSFSADFSVGGGAGGVSVLVDLGFNAGYSYTNSTKAGTHFGGTIGNLPDVYFADTAYSYRQGLFVYPYENSVLGQSFWVVNYWVE